MRRFVAAVTATALVVLLAPPLQAQLPAPVEVRTYLAEDPAGPLGYFGFNHLGRQVQCPDLACRYTTYAFAGVVGIPCPDPWAVHGAPGPPLLPVPEKDRFLYQYDEDGVAPGLPTLYTRPFHPGPDPTATGEDQVHFVVDGLRPARPPGPGGGPTEVRVRIVPPGVRKPSALAVVLDAAGDPDPTLYSDYFAVVPGLAGMMPDVDGDGVEDCRILANPATARTQLWTIEFYDRRQVRNADATAPVNGGQFFGLWRGNPPPPPPPARPIDNLDCPRQLPRIAEAMGNTARNSHMFYAGLWVSNSEEIAFAFSPDIWTYPDTSIQFRTYSNCTYYPVVPDAQPTTDQNPVVELQPGNPGVFPGANFGTVRLTDEFMATPHTLRPGETGVGRVEVQELVRLRPGAGPGGPREVWRPYDVDPLRPPGLGTDPNGNPDDKDLLLDADGLVGGTTSGNPAYTDKSLFAQFMSSRERVDPAAAPPGEGMLPPMVRTPLVAVPPVGPGTQTPPTPFAVDNFVTTQTLRCQTCGARHMIPSEPAPPAGNDYPHPAGPLDPTCEYCGTTLSYEANLEAAGADLGFDEHEAMASPVGGFSRSSLGPTAPLRMPFETALFAPLMAHLPVAGAPVTPAEVSLKVPKYQPPATYSGVLLAMERRDEQQRWYVGPTGLHFNYTGPPGAARPGDVLYDDNGQWDAYYQCPDCGNKQDAAGPCLNGLCPGHVICPIHLSLLPAGIPACPFYFPDGDGPLTIAAVDPGGPPGVIGVADVSAEEYDPFLLETLVGPAPGSSLGPQTVSLGKVQPGAPGPVSPDDPAGADIFPKERTRPAELPARNEGNVPVTAALALTTPLVRTEVSDAASAGRVQQSSAINPTGLEFTNYADAKYDPGVPPTGAASVELMPPYADDEAGSPYSQLPGTGTPGPTALRAGTTAGAPGDPIVPVGSGTPAGEYAGDLALVVGGVPSPPIPVRARVVEGRMPLPGPMTDLVASEAGPSPYFEPGGELSLVFSSNTLGAPPPPAPAAEASHNVYAATMAPLVLSPADPFYRAHNLGGAAVAPVSPPGPPTNVLHARAFAFVDDPYTPLTAWVYWHTRQHNPGTGHWNSFLSYYNAALGGPGTPLFDSRQQKGGVVGLIPQEAANPGDLHWLFWHAGEEGRQQVGFTPQLDPTLPSTMNDYWLHLTNARMGTSDPKVITYTQYGSVAPTPPSVTIGSVIRKPDSNPFVFTKDPWVFAYPDNRPLPDLSGPQFADEDQLLNVFYAAQVRRQGNSDICWSMFDAYAGAATAPLMTSPGENYGKRPFPREYGEQLKADGQYQVFEAQHLDWVISAGFPNTSAPFDPVLTVVGIGPLVWSGGDTGANNYDPKTGLINLQPTNLPPDPVTGGAIRVQVDPSAGVVAFSRSLLTVFGGRVTVELDYQPFTWRLTTDGNNDDSPVAFVDRFARLVAFWRRSHSVSEAPHIGATSVVYKTFSTSIQVLAPPIVSVETAPVPAPTVTDVANGVLWWDPSTIATLPFSITIGYNGMGPPGETHQVVGWSKEVVVPLDTVAAEGPIDVAQEMYPMPGGMTGVKYWLFWTSNRGYYSPGAGSLAADGRSDIYYTTVCPTFDTDVPE